MSTYADRLAALREQLKSDRLDGFVVPLTDEHMSEYVGSYAKRLEWLTGFKGSAGSAVVLPEEAAIFTDGRYTLQVRSQVDGEHWSLRIGAADKHRRLAEGACAAGRADRLRPMASHPRLGDARRRKRSRRAAPSWWRWRATRSTACGRTGPKRRRRTSSSSRTNMRASPLPKSVPRSATGWRARRRCRGVVRPQFDRLGVQCSRAGCRANAGRPGLCHRPQGRHRRLVRGRREGRAGRPSASRQRRPPARPHGVRGRARGVQGQDGRRRSRASGGGDLRGA